VKSWFRIFLFSCLSVFFFSIASSKEGSVQGHSGVSKVHSPEKEIEKIQENIHNIGKDLASLQKRLKEEGHLEGPTVKERSFFLQFFGDVPSHFKKRFQEFIGGIKHTRDVHLLLGWAQHAAQSHILIFFTIALLSLGSIWIGNRFYRSYILHFFGLLYQKQPMTAFQKTSILSIVLMAFALPYYVASFVLEELGYSFFQGLPVVFYGIWAVQVWIKCILHPSRPWISLFPTSIYVSKAMGFWINLILRLLVASFFLFHLPIVELQYTFLAISDIFGTFVFIAFFRLLKLLQAELQRKNTAKKIEKSLRWIFYLRLLAVIFLILWISWRQVFYWLIAPASLFLAFLWFKSAIRWFIHRFRVVLLWKKRHSMSVWNILLNNDFIEKLFLIVVYFLIFSLSWHLWQLGNVWDSQANEAFFMWIEGQMGSKYAAFSDAFVLFFIAYIIDRFGSQGLVNYVEKRYVNDAGDNDFLASRLKTLLVVGKTSLHIVVWIPTTLAIIGFFYDITPFLASVGFATFGFTFGIQTIVKDFITGFFIILENNLMVGDIVTIDGHAGTVELLTLRTVKLRTDHGVLLIIPFGSVTVIGNKSREFSRIVINISVDLKEDFDKVHKALEKSFQILRHMPKVGVYVLGGLELRGINELTNYSVVFQGRIKTAPGKQDVVRRAFNSILQKVFDEQGIKMPQTPGNILHTSNMQYIHTM
jgi:small-conductance mechanosensitive channel